MFSVNAVTFKGNNLIYFTHTGEIPMSRFHEEVLVKPKKGEVYEHNIETG